MNLLLDTHVVIWFITDDKKLPQKIKSIIENIDNSVFISLASLWELAIKHSLKKLKLKSDLKEIFQLIQDFRNRIVTHFSGAYSRKLQITFSP